MKNASTIIALGGNLHSTAGSPLKTLEITLGLLQKYNILTENISAWWRTPAYPRESGPDFVNGVVSVKCNYTHNELLSTLHKVENHLGRKRDVRWGPRVVDLDLIAYGDAIAPDETEVRRLMTLGDAAATAPPPDQLILPHPRMHERAFVLVPMAEVAPDWRHPLLGKTTTEMLNDLPPEAFEGMSRL